MSAALEVALAYARREWPVFPVSARKVPLTEHGLLDAITNEAQIREWWTRWPDAVPSISTGKPDVAIVVERLAGGPAVLIGHAFGQRVARMLATMHPDLVEGIVSWRPGARSQSLNGLEKPYRAALIWRTQTTCTSRMYTTPFFAPGNDPAVWRSG